MDDLVTFLRARLADEEHAQHNPWTAWHARECETVQGAGGGDPITCSCGVPARVLRDVAAKHAVLEALERADAQASGPDLNGGIYTGLRDAAELLALAYADHPDHRPGWPR